MIQRKRIGEMLIEAGLLTPQRLEEAIAAPRPSGVKLGQFLIREGYVRERDLVELLSSQLRIPVYQPDGFPIDGALASLLPASVAGKQRVAPLRRENGVLMVAMPDPTDVMAMDMVQERVQVEVEPVICTEEEFDGIMGSLYGMVAGEEGVPQDIEEVDYGSGEDDSTVDEEAVRSLVDMAEGQTAVRNVNWILVQAMRNGASDVHISPEKNFVRIRMRVDGVLKEMPSLPKGMEASLISRIKILAQMDISVTRAPQDGRFSARIGGKEIHLRVSSMPTVHGENVVLRLLGVQSLIFKFEQLGMHSQDIAKIERVIQRPHGMVLATGPTGSGKTTTLYSILSRLNKADVNIITVEDPVEYRMERIRQVELNIKAGTTFASSLRAILRQDPDIIMVGEIRDAETASLAVQASLTGHLVLSTMHTNDAVGTVSRLSDMGIEPFLVASVLSLVVAQRLGRKLCEHCAVGISPEPGELAFWGLEGAGEGSYRKACGCSQCRHTGYRGRVGVYESLDVTDGVRAAILNRNSEREISDIARKEAGFRTLREDCAEKIRLGLTTMEEGASVVVAG